MAKREEKMKGSRYRLVFVAALAGMLFSMGSIVTASAHDDPAGPHIHIKGRLTTPDGRPLPKGGPEVRQVEAGIFPNLPYCVVRGYRWSLSSYDPASGSYDLVVYVEDLKMPGAPTRCTDVLSTIPTITVDKTKIRWADPNFTIVPK